MDLENTSNQIISANTSADNNQYCTFNIGDRLYGIDILDVKEFINEKSYFSISHTFEAIKGNINLRGQIYLVADIGKLLNINREDNTNSGKIIIFKQHIINSFGIRVDKIGNIIKVNESQIDVHQESKNKENDNSELGESDIFKGVCKLKNSLIILLDSIKLGEFVKIRQDKFLKG